jgi:hypothetical protein
MYQLDLYLKFIRKYLIFLFLLSTASLIADPLNEIKNVNSIFDKGIQVDLRSPSYADGVLTTDQGGIIKGPNLRIQAKKIVYTKKMVDGDPIFFVEAEGEVALEFGAYFFVGERLEYDFLSKTGVIYEARSAMEPWYFGGRAIELQADGSYTIYNGFITTSESYQTDWQVTAEEAKLSEDRLFNAKNVQFRFVSLPVFWLPAFKANLDSIFDNPIRYNITWGGRQHTRLEMQYEIFSWNRIKNFVRLDYRIKRGLGGGFYTLYSSEDHLENFEMINYIARDSSVDRPSERTRYRFQGVYNKAWIDDNTSVALSWDKLSDEDMATDYDDRNLEIETAGRTQFQFRKQQDDLWIGNFFSRVRVNTFETIKQELPTLELSTKPFVLGRTGIISENLFKIAYLDFQYAKGSRNVHNFNSTRFEFNHKLYRSFRTGIFTTTPQVGGLAIYYGSNPHSDDHWVTLGMASLETNTQLRKRYSCFNHVIKPFARYNFYTMPGVKPNKHYIFDIEDGWYKLNMATFGVNNSFYSYNSNGVVGRLLHLELFAHAFFDTPTMRNSIPRIYSQMTWNSLPVLQHIFCVGWDTERNYFDHFNFRNEWTISQDAAFTLEWRHRSPWSWRKADHTNFIIDSFRQEDQLRHSQLSDQRDTLLFHIFYRLHPSWAIEFESRHGWNRRNEPRYNEYEIDLLATIQTAWNIKLSFQRKEYDRNDNRVALYFNVGLPRPNVARCDAPIPSLNF